MKTIKNNTAKMFKITDKKTFGFFNFSCLKVSLPLPDINQSSNDAVVTDGILTQYQKNVQFCVNNVPIMSKLRIDGSGSLL